MKAVLLSGSAGIWANLHNRLNAFCSVAGYVGKTAVDVILLSADDGKKSLVQTAKRLSARVREEQFKCGDITPISVDSMLQGKLPEISKAKCTIDLAKTQSFPMLLEQQCSFHTRLRRSELLCCSDVVCLTSALTLTHPHMLGGRCRVGSPDTVE